MQEKPKPEYMHLFNATSKTIESLQELLIIQLIAKDAVDDERMSDQTLNFLHRTFDEHIAALQVLQVQCFSLALNARKKEKPRL